MLQPNLGGNEAESIGRRSRVKVWRVHDPKRHRHDRDGRLALLKAEPLVQVAYDEPLNEDLLVDI